MRLQKFLAEAGVASRRASEQIILAGHVTVNGQVVRTIDMFFPGANTTANFGGTLTVRSQGGTVAARVLDIDGDSTAIATMPIVPLP